MNDPRHLLSELKEAIKNPDVYAQLEPELDRFADEIRDLEKDKHYRDHPEEHC